MKSYINGTEKIVKYSHLTTKYADGSINAEQFKDGVVKLTEPLTGLVLIQQFFCL